MLQPTKPSLWPSLEFQTMSTVATRMSNRSKRSFELVAPSNTEDHPVKMKKPQCSSHSSIKYDNWNLDLSHLPLRHQHPLTSPFRHCPYLVMCECLNPRSPSLRYGPRTSFIPATHFLRTAGCGVSSSPYGSTSTSCFDGGLQWN